MSTVYKHWEALVKRVWGRSWKALHSSKVGWLEKVTSWKYLLTSVGLVSLRMYVLMWLTPRRCLKVSRWTPLNRNHQRMLQSRSTRPVTSCSEVLIFNRLQIICIVNPFTNYFHFQPFTNYFQDEHAWGPVSLERPDRWNFSTQEAIFATYNNHIKDIFDLPLCINYIENVLA